MVYDIPPTVILSTSQSYNNYINSPVPHTWQIHCSYQLLLLFLITKPLNFEGLASATTVPLSNCGHRATA